jgi:site-specific DNA-cytosine methylase
VLEAGLPIRIYIHENNNTIVKRATKHYLEHLWMQYPKQLPASAIQGCMSQLPLDIALIGDNDLRRLDKVDLMMAGWPCQGHSEVGFGQGL